MISSGRRMAGSGLQGPLWSCGLALLAHSLLTFCLVMTARSAFELPIILVAGLSLSALAVLAIGRALQNSTGGGHAVGTPARASGRHTPSIAHDLRTRLAIVTLQLNKIQDPRARAIEHDVKDLSDSIDQLALMLRGPAMAERDRG